jgi:hypothetical protein
MSEPLKVALHCWEMGDIGVDEVAASLVEGGMVPFEAMIKATQIVRERRQQRKRSPVASPEREPSNG